MIRTLVSLLLAVLGIIPSGQSFLRQLQPRDSVLVADQVKYGFRLDGVDTKTVLGLPDYTGSSGDSLVLVRGWQLDTLVEGKKVGRMEFERWAARGNTWSIEAGIVLAPFEEGVYHLPPIPVQRILGGRIDTLLFEPQDLRVTTIPVDTAKFVAPDLKGQIGYPKTVNDVLEDAAPWLLIALGVAALVILVLLLVKMILRRRREKVVVDPPHIVALRELDRYRGSEYWAPEKQKAFYSGITDALRNYIDARFGIDAPEMTTAELFAAFKTGDNIPPELYSEMKELFERADFVKFAKMTVSDDLNAEALPKAVNFVTSTYQTEIEKEVRE